MTHTLTKAREAASLAGALADKLVITECKTFPTEDRLAAAERAWMIWHQLCRIMSDLEGAMPRSSQAGYEMAERLQRVGEAA